MNPFLEAARAYRAAGLHPIPVEPRGKRPIIDWKAYQTEQPTDAELEQWWTSTPDANVALVMGRGAFAVDVDDEMGERALADAGINLDGAPRSRTARGYHVFFAGDDVKDHVGILPKVDIRGLGYVVAPPSVHASGHVYVWEQPIVGQLPQAPDALAALLRRPTTPTPGASASDWLTTTLAGVGEGGRDVACTRLAGYFLGKGLPVEAVEVILQAWADRCTPAFPSDQVTKCVASIAQREGDPGAPPDTVGALLPAVLRSIKADRPAVSATELGRLDRQLDGGFFPGELTLIGARPSIGKTAFALQVARKVAKTGVGVLIVSREMAKHAVMRRLLSQESYVRAQAIKTGELSPSEWMLLEAGAERLAPLPIWITTSVITVDHFATALGEFTPGQIGMGIVDYLQLMRGPADIRDKRATVEYVSQELKRLSILHNIPILCLSSLSRPPKQQFGYKPSLSDLRESGELEHDADNVILMHRESLDAPEAEFNVAKQRDGKVGVVDMLYRGDYLTFEEVKA